MIPLNRISLSALASAVIFASVSGADAQEPPFPVDPSVTGDVLLRYQFTEGESVTYRTEIDQRLEMSGEALLRPSETSMRLVMDAVHAITAVAEDGTGTFDQRVSGATVSVTVAGHDIPADDLARQLNGVRMTVQMSPLGELVDLTLDEVSDPQTAQMMGLIEESMRRSTIEFPETSLAIGDSWTRSVPLDLSQPGMEVDTNVDATYTLLGYADVEGASCAVLQTEVTLSVSGTFSDMGLTSTATGTGTGAGFTYFDVQAGKLAHSTLTMSLNTVIVATGLELVQVLDMVINISKL